MSEKRKGQHYKHTAQTQREKQNGTTEEGISSRTEGRSLWCVGVLRMGAHACGWPPTQQSDCCVNSLDFPN